MKNLTKIAATAALLATPFAAFADGHTEFTIRATANSNENDEDYDGLVVFKNYVEAASNGRVAVELFIGTQLCATGAECLEGVSEGSIDVYISTSGGAAGIFPYVQVLDLPYLMSSDRVAEAVLSGDFVRTLRDKALEDSDGTLRLMTVGNTGGWRNFANTERRVQTPADMAGLKLRTVVADLPVQLVEAMGGEINVVSAKGEGSDFYFSIPLLAAEQQQSAANDARIDPTQMKILIVDDQQDAVGAIHFLSRPAYAFLFDRVIAVPQTSGVNDMQGHALDLDMFPQQVPGCALYRRYDSRVCAGQGIE